MFARLKYHFLMHLIVLTWGFTGILGKLIQLNYYQIVFFRLVIAGVSLLLFLLISKKSFRIKSKKQRWRVIGIGIVVCIHWLCFYKAIQVSTASLGVLLLSTTTLHVSWLEPLVMKRKFSWIELIFGLLVIVGIGFISNNIDPSQYEGIFWGLLAAISAACFSVFNLKFKRSGVSSSSITLYQMFAGFGFLTLILLFQGEITSNFFVISWADFGWLLFLGIICTSAAYLLMIEIVDKIGAFNASLSINLEPVYSVLLAIIILQENQDLSTNFYFGTAFIVLVVIMNPIAKKWINRRVRMKRLPM